MSYVKLHFPSQGSNEAETSVSYQVKTLEEARKKADRILNCHKAYYHDENDFPILVKGNPGKDQIYTIIDDEMVVYGRKMKAFKSAIRHGRIRNTAGKIYYQNNRKFTVELQGNDKAGILVRIKFK